MIDEVGQSSSGYKFERFSILTRAFVDHPRLQARYQEAGLDDTVANFVELDTGVEIEELPIGPEPNSCSRFGFADPLDLLNLVAGPERRPAVRAGYPLLRINLLPCGNSSERGPHSAL